MVQIPMLQLSFWIDLWREDASLRALAARHWRDAYARILSTNATLAISQATVVNEVQATVHATVSDVSILLDGSTFRSAKWNAVLGPMTATMACLVDLGWDLSRPGIWVDPTGKKWIPDMNADKQPILDLVRDFAVQLTMREASKGWCARGMEAGVDWQATMALQKHIRLVNEGMVSENVTSIDECLEEQVETWPETAATWLELFLTGAYWPQARYAAANQLVDPV